MSQITSPPTAASRARLAAGSAAAALALGAAMAWSWGFTVDDALITGRVAHHLASGLGYRFNASGPVVDAVTPLGFAYVLSPFAGSGPMAALHAAKWLGALAMVGAAVVLGRRLAERTTVAYGAALIVALAGCLPLTAWAVAGMETGVVTALCVVALGRGTAADVGAAVASAWRPELLPWCIAVRGGLRLAQGAPVGRAVASAAPAVAAAAIVGVVRTWAFGRPAPLSVFAKPSDLEHGVSYALHALVQTGLPLLCLAPLALRRGAPVARAITAAGLVHFAALAAAGGDWMSLYRLAVPVLPSFALAAAELSRVARPWSNWFRLALSLAMSLYLSWALSGAARRVMGDRERLIAEAKPLLAGARVVAALDVGWVGAATPATIVDFAGVTDESIAMLPGGHTSKRIDDALVRGRAVDTLVLLQYPHLGEGYAREVERRAALLPSTSSFEPLARLPAGPASQVYVVLRRR